MTTDTKSPTTGDRLVNRKEAASMLGVCVRTIDALIREKKLRAVRIHRRVLVPFSTCQKLIAGRA